MSDKFQYFNGIKFTRDDKTGYYLNSTIRMRIHRYVWEFYNGPIPDGYCVHHIDHDKGNNNIENLSLMKRDDHTSMHGYERAETSYDEMIRNLDENARPKASEWHGSKAGIEWHSKHGKEVAESLVPQICKCNQCGKEYLNKRPWLSKFCSNACKSANRRESRIDNETRTCTVCDKEFSVNKYSKTLTCSRSCANKYKAKARRMGVTA